MTIAKVYGLAMKSMANGEIDWLGGTIKCALTSNTYVPNQDTHDYFNDVTDEAVEVSHDHY
jgi:hypothetical protein